jgi:hypothetical protein
VYPACFAEGVDESQKQPQRQARLDEAEPAPTKFDGDG